MIRSFKNGISWPYWLNSATDRVTESVMNTNGYKKCTYTEWGEGEGEKFWLFLANNKMFCLDALFNKQKLQVESNFVM